MSFSFITSKSLICKMCFQHYPAEENVPPDLFSLLAYHNIPQIHWFCKSCNNMIASSEDHHKLISRICDLEKDVLELKAGRNPRIIDYDEHDVRFNRSSSSSRFDSAGSPLRRRSSDFESDLRRSNTPETNNSFAKCASPYQAETQRSRSSSPPDQSFHSKDRSPDRNRDALRVISKILNEEIKIDKNQATHSVAIVEAFMNVLNNFLKKNDLVYKYFYSRDYKTGSSFNDLKISSANEYDINIMLIPPGEFELKVEFFKNTKAFSKIKWRKMKEIPESKECILKFFEKISDDQGYLNPLKLKHWFQAIIAKFCLTNPEIKGIKKFISSESGPARTIVIHTEKGYSISLDLVPVFTFGFEIFCENGIPRLQEYPLDRSKAFCSFVPKICECENLTIEESKLSWRTYIPEIDKKVLYNKQCAKNIIKLLKLLRDKENWKSIASYHLATVILFLIHENPSEEYWKGAVLFDRFIQALEKLQEYLNMKHLPYFVYPQFNLFHKLNPSQAENLSNRIQHIVKSLKSDHNYLTKIFKLEK